jgi:antitoxin (DNA-binding transcriptional repressor) of toxin-antitoxin stability system
VYFVHMKRMSAAAARQRFSDLLDAAERGEGVVIERRGVQFELGVRRPQKDRRRRTSLVQAMDPAVERGAWTWRADSTGLVFEPRKGRR